VRKEKEPSASSSASPPVQQARTLHMKTAIDQIADKQNQKSNVTYGITYITCSVALYLIRKHCITIKSTAAVSEEVYYQKEANFVTLV
jgi:cell division protein FtsB